VHCENRGGLGFRKQFSGFDKGLDDLRILFCELQDLIVRKALQQNFFGGSHQLRKTIIRHLLPYKLYHRHISTITVTDTPFYNPGITARTSAITRANFSKQLVHNGFIKNIPIGLPTSMQRLYAA
jgi:hypothetical protein